MNPNNSIKCILIDDEPLALELLQSYFNKTSGLEFIAKFSDPLKALHFLEDHTIDLIFLDIQMPELNGIQFMKIISDKCGVILTTAYSEYALDSYDHNVIDYLLKPVTLERFYLAAEKAKERLQIKNNLLSNEVVNYFFVKTEYRIQKINYSDVLYFEGLRDYVAIHTTSGKILTLQSMRSFEESLPPSQFIRIHKSYLIAINKIHTIEKNRVTIIGKRLPIGEVYCEKFWKKVNV